MDTDETDYHGLRAGFIAAGKVEKENCRESFVNIWETYKESDKSLEKRKEILHVFYVQIILLCTY